MASFLKALEKGQGKEKISNSFSPPWMQDKEIIDKKETNKAGDPAGNKADDPADNKADDPADNKADDPADNKADDPAGNKAGDPAGNKADDPADNKADNPADNKVDDPAGNKAGDPAGNKVGSALCLRNQIYDNEIVRRRVVAHKKKWRPKSKEEKQLNNKDYTFTVLSEIYGARKEVICKLFETLREDYMTPRLSSEDGARISNQKKSTFDRTVNRLSEEGILMKYGFRTRAGGRIYWFHPVVLECLNEIKEYEPTYFAY